MSEGICGAPIVEEDTSTEEQDGGGICGFFRMASGVVAACPCLDEIRGCSWDLF